MQICPLFVCMQICLLSPLFFYSPFAYLPSSLSTSGITKSAIFLLLIYDHYLSSHGLRFCLLSPLWPLFFPKKTSFLHKMRIFFLPIGYYLKPSLHFSTPYLAFSALSSLNDLLLKFYFFYSSTLTYTYLFS